MIRKNQGWSPAMWSPCLSFLPDILSEIFDRSVWDWVRCGVWGNRSSHRKLRHSPHLWVSIQHHYFSTPYHTVLPDTSMCCTTHTTPDRMIPHGKPSASPFVGFSPQSAAPCRGSSGGAKDTTHFATTHHRSIKAATLLSLSNRGGR